MASSNFVLILIKSLLCFLNNPLRCKAGNVLYSIGGMYPLEFLKYQGTLLTLQEDCCLAISKNGSAIVWEKHINASICELTLLNTGELLLFGQSAEPLWVSTKGGPPGEYVLVLTEMHMAVYGPSRWANSPSPRPPLSRTDVDMSANSILFPEQILSSGKSIKNGNWELKIQDDCNLVLSNFGNGIWSSKTSKGEAAACHLKMELTGDAVIYDESGDQIWSSNTSGVGHSVLVLRNDGKLVIYGPVIWTSGKLLVKHSEQSALVQPF
ncbi:hypothetical protein AAC387_Pa11g0419 [Persea americana]